MRAMGNRDRDELDRNALIDTKQAAALLGVVPRTLIIRRSANYKGEPGPPWKRIVGGVRYRIGDILDYIEARSNAKSERVAKPKPIPRAPSA